MPFSWRPNTWINVNALSGAIVGAATGAFIMSWNVTTFILYSRHFRFLATTTRPFLKYCTNNFILPGSLLIYYFFKAIDFDSYKGINDQQRNCLADCRISAGFFSGDRTFPSLFFWCRSHHHPADDTTDCKSETFQIAVQIKRYSAIYSSRLIRVNWYMSGPFSVKQVRDVSHYSKEFIDRIFSRHHFAAILSICIAFLFLGCWLDFLWMNPYFQLPAAASIFLFFSILLAVSGAFSYFLESWSIPFLVLLFFVLNILYHYEIIDPTNKAYGLNYTNRADRPAYHPGSSAGYVFTGKSGCG